MKNGEKPTPNPYVVLREEFDDWAVIFNPDTGQGFGLNPTGVYLWKSFDGKTTTEEILASLRLDAREVPPDAGTHLDAFLDALTHYDLLTDEAVTPHSFRTQTPSCPCPPSGPRVGDAFPYEPPALIDFRLAVARGVCNCSGGSGTDVGDCCPGSITSGSLSLCNPGTTALVFGCINGSVAAHLGCTANGSSATGTWGCKGTGSVNTSCVSGFCFSVSC